MINDDKVENWMKELGYLIMNSLDNSKEETFYYDWFIDLKSFLEMIVE